MFLWQNKKPQKHRGTIIQYHLYFIILLPAFSWRLAHQHLIGHFIVGDLFGFPVEFQFAIQMLRQYTKAEYLAKRAGNMEW